MNFGYELYIFSGGIQIGNPYSVDFNYCKIELNTFNIIREINNINPSATIFFVNLHNFFLFPVLGYLKFTGTKCIYWGHGLDLHEKNGALKNIAYKIEHKFFDGILLYAQHLKKFISPNHYHKLFIANNTLNLTVNDKINPFDKQSIKEKFGIKTSKNIIYMGRMEKRKRIHDLVNSFKRLKTKDVGLILAGPDTDGILQSISNDFLYKVGPVYGEDAIRLLSVSDVCCIPGPVGLGIVDAFYCGLPLVTEDVQHGPEIMYFEDGINGFMVNRGDVQSLSEKLDLILSDHKLRKHLSNSAKTIIENSGHIDKMCKGFFDILNFVLKNH